MPEHFKKSWIKGYSGKFYVNFLDDDIPNKFVLLPKKLALEKAKPKPGVFYRGSKYLDILLCGDIKQDQNVTVFTFNEKEYKAIIKYKLKDSTFVYNDEKMHEKENEWKIGKKKDYSKDLTINHEKAYFLY